MDSYGGLVLIAIGVFDLIAVIKDWDWYMKFNWPLIKLFKRKVVRTYSAIIGLIFIGLGIFLLVIKLL